MVNVRLHQSRCIQFAMLALYLAGTSLSCASMVSARSMHGGIRYTIAPDQRKHRIEKGKNGSLMYDAPDLTVLSENGRLNINGVDCGPVKKGDHVEITDTYMVQVNGEYRGDNTTGSAENQQRLNQSKMQPQRRGS